jgi:hypothetical protein
LRHPDQLALLRAEPHRLPAAVEEVLRHDGPLQVSPPLVTAAPIEVGGVTIASGELVVPGLLVANRSCCGTRIPGVAPLRLSVPSLARAGLPGLTRIRE